MVRQRRVLLNLEHLLRQHVGRSVLRAIHDARRERLIGFRERHHLRQRPERDHLLLDHLRGLDAHLEPEHVVGRDQRLVRREKLETVVPIGEPDDALGFSFSRSAAPIGPWVTFATSS